VFCNRNTAPGDNQGHCGGNIKRIRSVAAGAREIDIAARLLARSEDLEALAAGQREGLPLLSGWRYEQFGHDALDVVEGRLGFAVQGGKLKMTRTGDAA